MFVHFGFIIRYGYRDFGIHEDFIRTIWMSDPEGISHYYVRPPYCSSLPDGQSDKQSYG